MKVNKKIPVCPECSSTNVLTRQNGVCNCRRCGHQWDKIREQERLDDKRRRAQRARAKLVG